jgi:hypothetical protein
MQRPGVAETLGKATRRLRHRTGTLATARLGTSNDQMMDVEAIISMLHPQGWKEEWMEVALRDHLYLRQDRK